MCQDFSKQKQADEALRKSQKLASIRLLVAAIAHEINNPNGFIIFNLPILRGYLKELMSIADLHMKDYPSASCSADLMRISEKICSISWTTSNMARSGSMPSCPH